MDNATNVAAYWILTCQSAQSHAATVAANCRRDAATLIDRETSKFCNRQPPVDRPELARRQQQALFLIGKISSISHADQMARIHPNASGQILAETKAFLDRLGLDDSPYKESLALTSKISELCFADMAEAS